MSATSVPGANWAERLLAWWDAGHRDLPWRQTRDPYAIWVSEVMLQQTRVNAVIPFYEAFMKRYPTVDALAQSSEPELLSHWSGLGYYTRARNLHRAAKHIGSGAFPSAHGDIAKLPGIGEYTAAAIASIAFALRHAVVDGNVIRVLARVSAEEGDVKSVPVRRRLTQLAEELVDHQRPGDYNQAMMELGATLCLPRSPQCLLCPVRDLCRARAGGCQESFPVKSGKAGTKRIRRVVWVIRRGTDLLLWQRPETDTLMPGFWELPEREHLARPVRGTVAGSFRHSITRYEYAFEVRAWDAPQSFPGCKRGIDATWFRPFEKADRPISTVARKALQVAGELP